MTGPDIGRRAKSMTLWSARFSPTRAAGAARERPSRYAVVKEPPPTRQQPAPLEPSFTLTHSRRRVKYFLSIFIASAHPAGSCLRNRRPAAHPRLPDIERAADAAGDMTQPAAGREHGSRFSHGAKTLLGRTKSPARFDRSVITDILAGQGTASFRALCSSADLRTGVVARLRAAAQEAAMRQAVPHAPTTAARLLRTSTVQRQARSLGRDIDQIDTNPVRLGGPFAHCKGGASRARRTLRVPPPDDD